MLLDWLKGIVTDELKKKVQAWLGQDHNRLLIIPWTITVLVILYLLIPLFKYEKSLKEGLESLAFRPTTLWAVGIALTIIAVWYAAWNRFSRPHFFFGALPLLTLATCLCVVAYIHKPPPMEGDFNIAVADFSTERPIPKAIGRQISETLSRHLKESLKTLETGKNTDVRHVQTPLVIGDAKTDSSEEAEKLATEIRAHLVVYGSIKEDDVFWRISPRIYVPASFSAEQELTGVHALGAYFRVQKDEFEASDKLKKRLTTLARTMEALRDFANQRYDRCLGTLQQVASELSDDEKGSVPVVQLLIGNAAGKLRNLNLAEQSYKAALEESPGYARAYLGLAAVYLARAQQLVTAKEALTDVPFQINTSLEYYDRALHADTKPSLGDIDAKANLGMGLCYLISSRVSEGPESENALKLAVQKFEEVTSAPPGTRTRIPDFVGQAHACLGLIYEGSGEKQQAIRHYCAAKSLFDGGVDRKKYDNVVKQLQGLGERCQ